MGSRLEDQVNLYARHEALLLSHGAHQDAAIPAAIITGFLGAGKTTLIDHILRSRGGLRIAVLVNEVGAVDVDSQLVNTRSANAALGLPAADLSGGCLCCTALGGLSDALAAIRATTQSGASAPLDYLLVETSGVADAEPLAAALAAHGCRLEAVVAVVDAEAGGAALELEVAQAQVRCADVVVVNKCDVAGLRAAADVEDAVQRLSPGVRMVRSRFGRVPLPAILDVEPVVPLGSTAVSNSTSHQSDRHTAGASKPSIHGEIAFLSHEATVSLQGPGQPGFRVGGKLGPQPEKRKVSKLQHQYDQRLLQEQPQSDAVGGGAAASHESHTRVDNDGGHSHNAHDHQHGSTHSQLDSHSHDERQHAHHSHAPGATHNRPPGLAVSEAHARLHAGYHTTCCTLDQPASMAGFQTFVALLVKTSGLYRAKGIMWFSEARLQRYTFHLSGRQRVECVQEGVWDAPPKLQLVLIGSDPGVLQTLKASFLQLAMPPSSAADAVADTAAVLLPQQVVSAVQVLVSQMHERLEARDQADGPGHAASSGGSSALELRVKGDALHGVRGEEVCASIMRRVNAGVGTHGVLLFGVAEPPGISAVGGSATHGTSERMRALQLVPPAALLHRAPGAPADVPGAEQEAVAVAEVAQRVVAALAQPLSLVMRQAFPHMGCRCDMVAGMRAP